MATRATGVFKRKKIGPVRSVSSDVVRAAFAESVKDYEWFGVITEEEVAEQLMHDLVTGKAEHYEAGGYIYTYKTNV